MRCSALAVAALVALSATPAAAVTLALGDNVLPGTNPFVRPELAATVIANRQVDYSLVVGGQLLSGKVQQAVARTNSDGTLQFLWRIMPGGDGTLPVFSFRLGGFGDYITDGDWRTDGLGEVAPTLAHKFDGGFVNFFFQEPVGPTADQSSRFFFLKTTATRFDRSGAFDVLCSPTVGCASEVHSAFAPSAGVPEPAAWALMIVGFAGAGAALRRRRRIGLTAA